MGVRSQKLIIFWLYVFDIQQDEDQEDPDERHDPDSDMEIDGHRVVEESTRSLSLSLFDVSQLYLGCFILMMLICVFCLMSHFLFAEAF
jgi:hypothetical protein